MDANNPFYDVAKYMSAIMHALPEVYGDVFYEELKAAFNDCLVAQVFNDEDNVFTYTPELVDVSKWAGTLASVYEPTVFDKTVGWSRWIRLNRQEPSLWSKSGFSDELDDDDQ